MALDGPQCYHQSLGAQTQRTPVVTPPLKRGPVDAAVWASPPGGSLEATRLASEATQGGPGRNLS